MTNKNVDINTDLLDFQERVDEVLGDVAYDRICHIVSKLKDALYANKNVPALCAPQIHESLRLFVVRNGVREENRFKVFLNPIIVSGKGLHLSRERSASIPGKDFIIPRKNEIHVAYQQPDGMAMSETFVGAYAEVVQQMIEMLDGITLADYGFDLDDVGGATAFDNALDKDKVEVISMYLNTLKDKNAALVTEIDNDPTLKALSEDIEFKTQFLLGNVKIEYPEQQKGSV